MRLITDLSVGGSPPESPAPGTSCRLPGARSSLDDSRHVGEGDRTLADARGGSGIIIGYYPSTVILFSFLYAIVILLISPVIVRASVQCRYVGNFVKRSERVMLGPEAKYTNLYMKNLDQDITEELIELNFSEFGRISNVKIARDGQGNSKGFGFVNFESPDSAKRATEAMNGVQLGSKNLYVARAQKRAERQQILQRLYEEKRNE